MRLTKLTATLFATTIMAGVIVLPEATHGAQKMRQLHEEQMRKEKAAATTTAGAHNAQAVAMEHPDQAIMGAAPAPIGNTLRDALAVPLGHNPANVAEGVRKLREIEAAVGNAGAPLADRNAIPAIKQALGITTFNDGETRRFLARLIAVTSHEHIIIPHVLINPHAALTAPAAPGNLGQLAADASADGQSGAGVIGALHNTLIERVELFRALEGVGGAGAAGPNNANTPRFRSELRRMLGLDPNPANFGGTFASVNAFLTSAESVQVVNDSNPILGAITAHHGAPALPAHASLPTKLDAVRDRMRNATNGAAGGPGGPGAGAPIAGAPHAGWADIEAALTNMGLN